MKGHAGFFDNRALRLLILLWAAAGAGGTAGDLVQVPDPLSGDNPVYPLIARPEPTVGESFSDIRFGTRITRVTATEGIDGRHQYSRHDPFNADGSMILLLPEYDWRIFRTDSLPYNQSANRVAQLRDVREPRWDPTDPNLLWGLQDFSIITIDARSGQQTLVKDFAQDSVIAPILAAEPDLYRITTRVEGESSTDKRYWAFLIEGSEQDYRARYLFTWDRLQDAIPGVHAVAADEAEIDWVGMSPLGHYVLIGGDDYNGGQLVGLTMANRELTRFHRLDYSIAHADVGLDRNGREVIVMQNIRTDHIDLIPIDWNTQPILESGGSYAGTQRTPLIRLYYAGDSAFGFNSGVHISCNAPGYCVISTYIEPGVPGRNWLDRSIVLVELDPDRPIASYLAKVHGTTGSYWEETQASIAADASKVVWASNWGQDVGQERVFLLQLDLDANGNGVPPTGWMTLHGNVRRGATPVNALILANGQFMFSADPVGVYALNVPLDSNGQVTLFGFADGMLPYKETFTPTATDQVKDISMTVCGE